LENTFEKKSIEISLIHSDSETTLNEVDLKSNIDLNEQDNNNKNIHFEILSNPEFLAEGTAINDLLNPDRVLIGGLQTKEGIEAQNLLYKLYSYWIPENKIIKMNLWSAELAKLVLKFFKIKS